MRGLRCDRLAARRISERSVLSETRGLLRLKLRTLDPCSFAAHGTIQDAGQWLINNSQHALAVFGESDLNREIAVAVDETIRAVEWIDHPDARLSETAFCVDRFFREDSVVGKLAFQVA